MPDRARDRSRLIDHFKDIHVVIAGLAITYACGQLFPFGFDSFVRPTLWMFGTLLITIIPILHGSSRSLDVKYLDWSPERCRDRAKYIWDVYMLLLTAIFFVAVAYALPSQKAFEEYRPSPDQSSYSPAAVFYYWFGATFAFDVIILVLDWIKSHVRTRLRSYIPWIAMNGLLAFACLAAATLIGAGATNFVQIGRCSVSLSAISMIIFALAFARTIADYALGDEFMFP